MSGQPLSLQRDIKAFFGSYTRAQEEANALLFSVGDTDVIDRACREAKHGRLVENALLVTRGQSQEISPTLRVFEGCARAILGEVEGANVVKLHRFSGKVTYLVCRALKGDPNPEVSLRVKVNLRSLSIDIFDYSNWSELPRLNVDFASVGIS